MTTSETETNSASDSSDEVLIAPVVGKEKLAGKPMTIGGVLYLVPALSFFHFKDLRDKIRRIEQGLADDDESIETSLTVIYCALKRNYPDITMKFILRELLDLGNIKEFMSAAVPKVPTEAIAPHVDSAVSH
jgi:hypothetical protein